MQGLKRLFKAINPKRPKDVDQGPHRRTRSAGQHASPSSCSAEVSSADPSPDGGGWSTFRSFGCLYHHAPRSSPSTVVGIGLRLWNRRIAGIQKHAGNAVANHHVGKPEVRASLTCYFLHRLKTRRIHPLPAEGDGNPFRIHEPTSGVPVTRPPSHNSGRAQNGSRIARWAYGNDAG
jgi:hypothetical protein